MREHSSLNLTSRFQEREHYYDKRTNAFKSVCRTVCNVDTHLDNEEARQLYKKYLRQFEELKAEFEEKFGPLTLGENNSDEWLKDPWPWDADC